MGIGGQKVPYHYKEHSPLLGEYWLRYQVRNSGLKKATTPLYLNNSNVIGDSFEIMRYADKVGEGDKIFPENIDALIWRDKIESAFEEMRKRISQRILRNPNALKEAAAGVVPEFIAGFCKPLAVVGVNFLAHKYNFDLNTEAADTPLLKAVLNDARDKLIDGNQYIAGTFSAVDIMVATLRQAVEPIDNGFIALGPAARKTWYHQELALEFQDLVEWPNHLYAKHRKDEQGLLLH